MTPDQPPGLQAVQMSWVVLAEVDAAAQIQAAEDEGKEGVLVVDGVTVEVLVDDGVTVEVLAVEEELLVDDGVTVEVLVAEAGLRAGHHISLPTQLFHDCV